MWNVTPQNVVSVIGVAKGSTLFVNELVDKGYVVAEIPPWIVSDETAALSARGRSQKDAEQTPRSLLQAPPVLETPGIGEGSPGDGSALRSDQQRALTTSATADIDAVIQQRLRDVNVV